MPFSLSFSFALELIKLFRFFFPEQASNPWINNITIENLQRAPSLAILNNKKSKSKNKHYKTIAMLGFVYLKQK